MPTPADEQERGQDQGGEGSGRDSCRQEDQPRPAPTEESSPACCSGTSQVEPVRGRTRRAGRESSRGTAWLAKPHTEVSASFPSSVGHHTAHSPQPSPTASESQAVLVGFSSVNALPIKIPADADAQQGVPRQPGERDRERERIRRIAVERVHDDALAHPAEDRPAEEQRRERGDLEASHEVEEDPAQEAISDPGDQELQQVVPWTPEGPEDSLREEEQDVAVGEDDGGFA